MSVRKKSRIIPILFGVFIPEVPSRGCFGNLSACQLSTLKILDLGSGGGQGSRDLVPCLGTHKNGRRNLIKCENVSFMIHSSHFIDTVHIPFC